MTTRDFYTGTGGLMRYWNTRSASTAYAIGFIHGRLRLQPPKGDIAWPGHYMDGYRLGRAS